MTSIPVKQKTRPTIRPRKTARTTRRLLEFAAMERRRMQAADLFERDVIPAEIARRVGVSHQVVSDWRTAWRQGVREALRSAGRAGRKPKLSDEQRFSGSAEPNAAAL
jgi:hypothetical protein